MNCAGCGCTLLKDGSTYCPRCRGLNKRDGASWTAGARQRKSDETARLRAANLGRLTAADDTADVAIQRADLHAELKRIAADPLLSAEEKTEAAWTAIERGSVE